MYNGLLNTAPEIGPLLVRLYDQDKLQSLSLSHANGDEEARLELTNIMVDLLGIQLKTSESELISDVLIGLLNKAEEDLRISLSERLAGMDNAPLRMLLHVANDEPKVAAPVLKKSVVLNDMDLVYIVKSKGAGHWKAIAERAQISETLLKALVETKDLEVANAITRNQSVTLNDFAVQEFSKLARISDELAENMIGRNDVPQKAVTAIYQFAGRALKEHIRQKYDEINAASADHAIDDIISQMSVRDIGDFAPSVDLLILAENMMEKGFLTTEVMISNLRRGQVVTFIAQFSVYCGLPEETVRAMLCQRAGQGLAIAAKATNIAKPEFVNMFLLTHRLRNEGGRVVNKEALGKALKYYDRVTESMAREILNQSRH